jgi:hypothetical protein
MPYYTTGKVDRVGFEPTTSALFKLLLSIREAAEREVEFNVQAYTFFCRINITSLLASLMAS